MAFQFLEGYYARLSDVEEWFNWFEKKGVPAAIVERDTYPHYTLWRAGKQALDKKSERARVKWESWFVIVKECHNFSKEVKK